MTLQLKSAILILAFATLGWTASCLGQATQPTPMLTPGYQEIGHQETTPPTAQSTSQRLSGSISGTVVDQSGAVVAGAKVKLTDEDQSLNQDAVSGNDGQFTFANIAPGNFQLTITAAGFAMQTYNGILLAGEIQTVPQIALEVASAVTEVRVGVPQEEVAEEQIKMEEKQRVLGAIPNFYVTYVPNAVALTSKQKFKLAWKTSIDPFTFAVVAGAAGVQQAQNHFKEYGQGVQGYAKRFGAGYADTFAGVFVGGAIFPSLFKQDPRYFYKGTGSMQSRSLYAIANAFICKGDNGHWQVNYSNILGNLAAGGISNLYYPADDRNGAALTFENGALGIGITAASNLLQEFVIRKLTPKVPKQDPASP